MKLSFALLTAFALCAGCNNDSKTPDVKTDTAGKPNITLAYTTKETPSWEAGSSDNVSVAMNALKGFETGDIDNTRKYFADTVVFRADYYHFKGTADSLMKELKKYRSGYTSFAVNMEDYESVKSKNNGDEYVSFWYGEKFTDSKGKMDSVFVMDDIKLVNGKITGIDSKMRHYPVGQPK